MTLKVKIKCYVSNIQNELKSVTQMLKWDLRNREACSKPSSENKVRTEATSADQHSVQKEHLSIVTFLK